MCPAPLLRDCLHTNPKPGDYGWGGLFCWGFPPSRETWGMSNGLAASNRICRAGQRAWCAGLSSGAPLVWEEQEPREDAVGATDAHHAIVVIHLQPDLVPSLQVEEDAT